MKQGLRVNIFEQPIESNKVKDILVWTSSRLNRSFLSMNIPNQRVQHNLLHRHICLTNKVHGNNLQNETPRICPATIKRRIEFNAMQSNEDYFGLSNACLVPIQTPKCNKFQQTKRMINMKLFTN